ncbi:F-box domain-containing protein [Mycena venus]|uniref:F-box domain-containing protein n=1 Tax=Mycena venus TaxID=2733690 RepID=A0A8H6WYF6_9AGAR|nr:F-box domain-containing protein [Mycena venus]
MSAARTFRQFSAASGRISSRQLCSSSLVRLPLLARTVSRIPIASRAFSASARSLKAGSSDVLLAQKLSEELKYENEETPAEEPEFLTSFNAQGIWKAIISFPVFILSYKVWSRSRTPRAATRSSSRGNSGMKGASSCCVTTELVLKHRICSIRLTFSVADLQNQDPPEQFEEELDEENPEPESSGDIMRVVVSITKSTALGALDIDMTLQNGQFLVENVTHYPDAKLGTEVSVENDWKRRGLYLGPEFTTLDVAVQEQFEKFLEERDIGESTAFFIPEYAQYKEQREYVNWLQNVKNFVDA